MKKVFEKVVAWFKSDSARAAGTFVVFIVFFLAAIAMIRIMVEPIETPVVEETETEKVIHNYLTVLDDETEVEEIEEPPVESEPIVEEQGYQFTDDDISLLAKLVEAEAGNQTELGKRLVIDVVLNRLDHPNFPDTVYDVIYQKNQFSPATYGTIDLYSATEENIQLVLEEIERRTDHDVVFFRAEHYGNYGVPMYSVGAHYFSSYD